jgi:hypothetical protein
MTLTAFFQFTRVTLYRSYITIPLSLEQEPNTNTLLFRCGSFSCGGSKKKGPSVLKKGAPAEFEHFFRVYKGGVEFFTSPFSLFHTYTLSLSHILLLSNERLGYFTDAGYHGNAGA